MSTTARTRRFALLAVVTLAALAAMGPALAVTADPHLPIGKPGGLTPAQSSSSAPFGDCALDGVTCKPPSMPGSCTGYSSQTVPPTTIKVLRANKTIDTVDFQTYVERVLPNEWIPTWDGDALKAGAVAVKSYGWYWVNHFGGYLDGDRSKCFDVTDDKNFQVYNLAKQTTRTDEKVRDTWAVTARINGQVIEASYQNYLKAESEGCGEYADGVTMSQYGSQACNEANTGNKYNVILHKYYRGVQLATLRQQRTPTDFRFEQTSTRVTYTAGRWTIDDDYPTTFAFGATSDRPVGATDAEGFALASVYRPSTGTWYIASPTGAIASKTKFGISTDIPVPAHWAGLGKATVIAVYRPSTGTWYVQGQPTVQYGGSHDIPVPGDYNGDGKTDLAVYRPSTGTWYVHGQPTVQYGGSHDIPVPGDYNGDGKTDLAVYRPSTGTWYVHGQSTVKFGLSNDVPVVGDYNGDGKSDFAIYRPSDHSWHDQGLAARVFGSSGSVPVSATPARS